MIPFKRVFIAGVFLAGAAWAVSGVAAAEAPFSFAVSGDSRNCGDLVMPAIARQIKGAKFYWHLGDFRKHYDVDEDIIESDKMQGKPPPEIHEYYDKIAWPDFIKNQVNRFSVPVYLIPGNHEMAYPTPHYPDPTPLAGIIPPTTKDYMAAFGRYRPADADNKDHPYYSWKLGPVAFIALDNSRANDFDEEQMRWFDRILRSRIHDRKIRSIVVGMHEALPGSIAAKHSMDEGMNKQFGEHVYHALVLAQNEQHKRVYVLASHAHYYMEGAFNNHPENDRLPGWIVGTAGAERYALPAGEDRALPAGQSHPLSNAAQTHVYGFMTGQVASDGAIRFSFTPLSKADLESEAVGRYSSSFVDFCFDQNAKK